MTVRVFLAGNPNCGKTTIFNALTGLRHKVANYPGVTVEKKEGTLLLPDNRSCLISDLPGIYSLNGHSLDELIATKALLGQVTGDPLPDLIVNVVDASNVERNLYLTSQLLDLGIPVIVALNLLDQAETHGISVKKEILARKLGVPVIGIIAKEGKGVSELLSEIQRMTLSAEKAPAPAPAQWLTPAPGLQDELRAFGTAAKLYDNALISGLTILSEPERCPAALVSQLQKIHEQIEELELSTRTAEATLRYQWINRIVQECCSFTQATQRPVLEHIERLLVHRIWGTLLFLLIMALLFQAVFSWASYPMDLIDQSVAIVGNVVGPWVPHPALRSLLVDGVITGVGSALIFIPQIAFLFLFLGILEDSGYLSRAAFLMDRLMRPVGLQGRSFIPLLSSFACAIPGILSARTVPSLADRMVTILIAPLMSCSARLPVYTLLIAAFIPEKHLGGIFSLQGMTLFALYVLGILGAGVAAFVLKKSLFRGEPAIFVMEMPPFRLPSARNVLREVLDRVFSFLNSAGTVILACSMVLWFLASYPRPDPASALPPLEQSFAGTIGKSMEPVLSPLGYNWEIGVGILTSFAARELFVSTLATVYHLQNDGEDRGSLLETLKQKRANGSFSLPTALSLLVFYVFACQCMSTLAVCRRETGSWKWPILMFVYMTTLAYLLSFTTYRISLLLLG